MSWLVNLLLGTTTAVLLAVWWSRFAPPPAFSHYMAQSDQYPQRVGPPHPGVLAVGWKGEDLAGNKASDVISAFDHVLYSDTVGGYDDLDVEPTGKLAYLSLFNGSIAELELATGRQRVLVSPPAEAAGVALSPTDPDTLFICTLHSGHFPINSTDIPGLYALNVKTGKLTTLFTRVPRLDYERLWRLKPAANIGVVHTYEATDTDADAAGELDVRPIEDRVSSSGRLSVKDMHQGNSRPLAMCNDIAISNDGNRVFITETCVECNLVDAHLEVVSQGRNGHVWQYDVRDGTVQAIGHNYTFADGIVFETAFHHHTHGVSHNEESVLFAELAPLRLTRIYLNGEKAGTDEVVIDNLPGMPDGLKKDASGNVWVALINNADAVYRLVFNNRWLRETIIRIPPALLPVDKSSAFLVLSDKSKGSKPLLYSGVHDASKVTDVASVIPRHGFVYLSSYSPTNRGLHRIPLASLPSLSAQ